MSMKRYRVPVTTDGAGAATVYSPRIAGEIHSISYIKPGSVSFTDGVDFAITKETTGENLWTQNDVNASVTVYPRAPTHTQVGAAALYAAAGTGVLARIGLANDRAKIVIAAGGAAKNGSFDFLIA